MLDREGGRVAGRVDVVAADHAAVLVDRQVAVVVRGKARDPGADELGQRHRDVRGQQPASGQAHGALDGPDGRGARHEVDAGAVERRADRLAGGRAERLERRVLAGGDHEQVGAGQLGGGEQRQLVERQQPAGARGGDEGEPQLRLGGDTRQHVLDGAGAHRAAEGHGARHRLARTRAGGDDEDVVVDPVAVTREHAMLVRLHGGERVAAQPHAELGGEPVERNARSRFAAERRGHRGRALDQLRRGGQQLERDARAGEGAQGEDGFDGGHAGAGYEDSGHRPQVLGAGGAGHPLAAADVCGRLPNF